MPHAALDRTPKEGVKHHGTLYSYSKLGCRCELCLGAYKHHRKVKGYVYQEKLRRQAKKEESEFDVTAYWKGIMARVTGSRL